MKWQSKDYLSDLATRVKTKHRARVIVISMLLVSLAVYLSAPILTKAILIREMENRGWKAAMESAEVTGSGIIIKNFSALSHDKSKNVEFVKVKINFNLKEAEAQGGKITVTGPVPVNEKKQNKERYLKMCVKEVAIDWQNADGDGMRIESPSVSADMSNQSMSALMDVAEVSSKWGTISASKISAVQEKEGKTQINATTTNMMVHGRMIQLNDVKALKPSVSKNGVKVSMEAKIATIVDAVSASDLTIDLTLLKSSENVIETEVSASAKSVYGQHGAMASEEVFTNPVKLVGGARIKSREEWKTDLSIESGGATVRATLTRTPNKWEASAFMDRTQCDAVFKAIPDVMKQRLAGMEINGEVQGKAQVTVPTADDSMPEVKLDIDIGCKIERIPDLMRLAFSGKPFKRITYSAIGKSSETDAPLKAKGWISLPSISPYVTKAVVTTEDPAFWDHKGIDMAAVKNSIRDDVKERKFLRGASTIPMQLAKNLFLSREKTAARKIQEFFFALAISQHMNKEKILEAYLNVVEFGPDVHGIGQAARHYFECEPQRLSLAQSVFLASILPKPRTQHFGPDRKLILAKRSRVNLILDLMAKRGSITEEEAKTGKEEELILGGLASGALNMSAASEWEIR